MEFLKVCRERLFSPIIEQVFSDWQSRDSDIRSTKDTGSYLEKVRSPAHARQKRAPEPKQVYDTFGARRREQLDVVCKVLGFAHAKWTKD